MNQAPSPSSNAHGIASRRLKRLFVSSCVALSVIAIAAVPARSGSASDCCAPHYPGTSSPQETKGFDNREPGQQHANKPIIGINVDPGETGSEYTIPTLYVEAIRKSGGIPVLLPPVPPQDLAITLKKLDGVLMIGGDDYPPSLYDEKQHETVQLMPKERSDFDVELARAVLKTERLPFLGICAGCQVLNIASGGSLIQDIPSHKPESKVVHRLPKGVTRHKVTLVPDSSLAKIYSKTTFEVPTAHHQCVGRLGSQLKVAANTEDGLVESVENVDRRFVVGVQWHPERDYSNNEVLFNEFIKQCSEYKLARQGDNAL